MGTRLKNNNSSTYLDQSLPACTVPTSGPKDKDLFVQPVIVKDPTANPITDFGINNPFPIQAVPNSKYDVATKSAAGTAATTATFLICNKLTLTFVAAVTSGATLITVTGTTSNIVVASITLPTIATAEAFSVNFSPSVVLKGETLTLTVGADWTSGSVTANAYGN